MEYEAKQYTVLHTITFTEEELAELHYELHRTATPANHPVLYRLYTLINSIS